MTTYYTELVRLLQQKAPTEEFQELYREWFKIEAPSERIVEYEAMRDTPAEVDEDQYADSEEDESYESYEESYEESYDDDDEEEIDEDDDDDEL